jgi:hypothetical protein
VSRECMACSHPESFAINEAIVVEKRSNRNIAKQFGLDYQVIYRHREHIPELLVKASQAMEIANADALLDKVEDLRVKAMAVLEEAEAAHDHQIMLAAIDRASNQLKLLAQLLGKLHEIKVQNNTQVNIIALSEHPDYRRFQDVLARALAPYPAARYAVADALREEVTGGRAT